MLDFLGSLVPQTPEQWAIVFTTGGIVSIVLQVIKHFGKLEEAKKIILLLLGVLSVVGAWADKALFYASANPKIIVALNLGWIVTFAVYWHRFAVSPVYNKLLDFFNGIYADAAAYRSEKIALAAAEQAQAANPVDTQFQS